MAELDDHGKRAPDVGLRCKWVFIVMSRPSTSLHDTKEDVDARAKPAHDDGDV